MLVQSGQQKWPIFAHHIYGASMTKKRREKSFTKSSFKIISNFCEKKISLSLEGRQ
jgi:hypothetical protein